MGDVLGICVVFSRLLDFFWVRGPLGQKRLF